MLVATALSKAVRFSPTVLPALTMLPWPAAVVPSLKPFSTLTALLTFLSVPTTNLPSLSTWSAVSTLAFSKSALSAFVARALSAAFLLAATAVSKAVRFWPTVLSALTILPWPASVVPSLKPLFTLTALLTFLSVPTTSLPSLSTWSAVSTLALSTFSLRGSKSVLLALASKAALSAFPTTAASSASKLAPTVLPDLTIFPFVVVPSIIPLVTFTGLRIGLITPAVGETSKVVPLRTTGFAAPTTEIPATVAPIKPAKIAVVNFFPDNFILVSSLSSFENRHIL